MTNHFQVVYNIKLKKLVAHQRDLRDLRDQREQRDQMD
jgi:hypothetical protein